MASRSKTAIKPKDSTAAAQSAGYVLQLTRALHHFAIASSQEDVVAIEHFDDIAVTRDGRLVLVKQDKSTCRHISVRDIGIDVLKRMLPKPAAAWNRPSGHGVPASRTAGVGVPRDASTEVQADCADPHSSMPDR